MHDLAGWRRHAIYWMPEPGPLADFGARWLGWDAATGLERPHPDLMSPLPLSVAEITATPRKYGMHGTIKAPFKLAQGTTAAGLHDAMSALAAHLPAALMPGLRLTRIGPWIALVPEADTSPLAAIAARVVAGLDGFRAPPDPAEIARRNPATLTPAQRALLDRWGYPYVMEEFRFHITLSGALPQDTGRAVMDALAPVIAPILPRPFPVASLCLCGEGDDGRFRILHRYVLTG